MMGRHQHKAGALFLCLADGLGRRHAETFGQLVFGQNDAVPVFGVAGHRHGNAGKFGRGQRLNRREKSVAVAMQDHTVVHALTPPDIV